MFSEEAQRRALINVYMDLCNVRIWNVGCTWYIDSPESDPGPFESRAELICYIEQELEEIKKVYERNNELDELRAVYAENGLEVA